MKPIIMDSDDVINEQDTRIKDLEECLAGFMATAAGNGAYITDDMNTWIQSKLKGKSRTPVQVWRELTGLNN